MNIHIGERNLTGIEVVDNNSTSYYKYDRYAPNIVVYPLYDNQTAHETFDGPIPSTDYTMTLAANSMFMVAGTVSNTIKLESQLGSFEKTLSVVVNSGRENQTPTLSLTGQIVSFWRYQTFSLDGLIVKAHWSSGSDTTPIFSASGEDGTYKASRAPDSVFSALGTETITITYYINSGSVSTTYTITVDNNIYTFFNHAFSDGTEWGGDDDCGIWGHHQ